MIKPTRAAKWLGRVSALRFGAHAGRRICAPTRDDLSGQGAEPQERKQGRKKQPLKRHPLRLHKVVD